MSSNPANSAPAIVLAGIPEPNVQGLKAGTTLPVAVHVNGDNAVVGYIRRWQNDSLHYELARLRRYGEEFPWEVRTVGGSALPPSAFDPLQPDQSTGIVQLVSHVKIIPEDSETYLHEIMGKAADSMRAVNLVTALEEATTTVTPRGGSSF